MFQLIEENVNNEKITGGSTPFDWAAVNPTEIEAVWRLMEAEMGAGDKSPEPLSSGSSGGWAKNDYYAPPARLGLDDSSCCPCSCTITVTLVPECGVEFLSGVAYAIGTQTIATSLDDPCGIIGGVTVNGVSNSAVVADGGAISIGVNPMSPGRICTSGLPTCEQSMFVFQRAGLNRLKVSLNPKLRFVRRRLRG